MTLSTAVAAYMVALVRTIRVREYEAAYIYEVKFLSHHECEYTLVFMLGMQVMQLLCTAWVATMNTIVIIVRSETNIRSYEVIIICNYC